MKLILFMKNKISKSQNQIQWLAKRDFFFSFAVCRPNNNLPCSWHALSWQEACTSISVLWKSNILLSLASFWNDHNNSKSLTRTAPPKQNVCPAFFFNSYSNYLRYPWRAPDFLLQHHQHYVSWPSAVLPILSSMQNVFCLFIIL